MPIATLEMVPRGLRPGDAKRALAAWRERGMVVRVEKYGAPAAPPPQDDLPHWVRCKRSKRFENWYRRMFMGDAPADSASSAE